jgi:hypothetical protein
MGIAHRKARNRESLVNVKVPTQRNKKRDTYVVGRLETQVLDAHLGEEFLHEP